MGLVSSGGVRPREWNPRSHDCASAGVFGNTQRLDELARRIATSLDHVGTIGVEFFVLSDGSLMVNEMALARITRGITRSTPVPHHHAGRGSADR